MAAGKAVRGRPGLYQLPTAMSTRIPWALDSLAGHAPRHASTSGLVAQIGRICLGIHTLHNLLLKGDLKKGWVFWGEGEGRERS